MPSPERKLERQLVAYCKQNGVYCRKFVSPGCAGVPDRILLRAGQVVFLELKSPGKKPSALQTREMELIRRAGGVAMCEDSWEVIQSLIDTYLL